MGGLFGIGFLAPGLLYGLLGLPLLWVLLRAVPPAPIKRMFPGVILLLGLNDEDSHSDRTPWWLLMIRLLAIAAIIVGFAGPVLSPGDGASGKGRLLVLLDGTWAEASDWTERMARVDAELVDATASGRPVAVVGLSDIASSAPTFLAATEWRNRLAGIEPRPWGIGENAIGWAEGLTGDFDTVWLSNGLKNSNRTALFESLNEHGNVRVLQSGRAVYGLSPAEIIDEKIVITVSRVGPLREAQIEILAHGRDPAGIERILIRQRLTFEKEATTATANFSVEPEIRNRITRFALLRAGNAGEISLTDGALARREVAVIAGQTNREGLLLLSPTHFLEQALEPNADLIEGTLGDVLSANPDLIVMADIVGLADTENRALRTWVEAGGVLVRFAGPKLAAASASGDTPDPLLPVRLRAGGRTVGGAMSWGEPRSLDPFPQSSPFFGLDIPDDVLVSAQVLAEPGPDLSQRVIARLTDGTPLVTRKRFDAGQVVLFHVTANSSWSTLPLSGLYVEMLERLAAIGGAADQSAKALAGTTWNAEQVLDAFGNLSDAGNLAGVAGEDLVEATIGRALPPGIYAGPGGKKLALNVIDNDQALEPATWPANVTVKGLATTPELPLKALCLAAALLLLTVDLLASLAISGRWRGALAAAKTVSLLIVAATFGPQELRAQADQLAIDATSQITFAHVTTGDARVDQIAQAGLRGLSDVLFNRTSVEPAAPVALDIESDELSYFPFLYWPVSPDQATPSADAYARLNRYLRNGGMILFDTRDADVAGIGTATPNGRALRTLAMGLDIPPLEPVPQDHVLTRTFYLLETFPGRYPIGTVWVEEAPQTAEPVEGMPFRNLNDNVTPVIIGGNDWASAWAVDEVGAPMFPVGRGVAGDQQREISRRFGVNLIMYVLTGNYKSDQVHVPALLDRLGQ